MGNKNNGQNSDSSKLNGVNNPDSNSQPEINNKEDKFNSVYEQVLQECPTLDTEKLREYVTKANGNIKLVFREILLDKLYLSRDIITFIKTIGNKLFPKTEYKSERTYVGSIIQQLYEYDSSIKPWFVQLTKEIVSDEKQVGIIPDNIDGDKYNIYKLKIMLEKLTCALNFRNIIGVPDMSIERADELLKKDGYDLTVSVNKYII